RIGLSGKFNGSDTVIDIDCVSTYNLTESVTVTSHPVESDPNGILNQVSDYVIPGMPSIAMNIILSDNLGLSYGSIGSKSVSMKDKVKILTFWQKTGTVISLLGYKTGGAIAGNALNALDSGLQNFFDISEPNAYYTGLDTDIISDLVLGSIIWQRKTELGLDVEATVALQKIHRVVAKTGVVGSSSSTTAANGKPVTNQGKKDTPAKPANKVVHSSKAADLAGKKI
ncbi:MAG TPA: hypothetical protein PLG41_24280, partial [Leptospiraceae bacterium]|nr:hypothetical protein [Leptospiraceae bacterium]